MLRLNPTTPEGREAVEKAAKHAAFVNPQCHYDLANPSGWSRMEAHLNPEQEPDKVTLGYIAKLAASYFVDLLFSPKRGVQWEHLSPGD